MPPWLPEPGELKFSDELRLTDGEISTIQAWVDQGEIEGDPADLPPRPTFTAGWQLGKPDVIVRAEKPYLLPASGSDSYWNFVFRTPVHRSRWLKAIEIRPGDKRLVHHANVLVDREENGRRLEKEPGAGFGGMELIIESEVFDPDSHFLFWKPGSPPYVEPDGMALRLDKNTDLVLNTHLQPSGKAELIQPTLGLYFTDKPATMHPILLQLDNDRRLDIPAGSKKFSRLRRFYFARGGQRFGHLSARPLSRKRFAGVCDAARWDEENSNSHRELGFELAGRLPLCAAGGFAGGNDDLDAVYLRQLGGQYS